MATENHSIVLLVEEYNQWCRGAFKSLEFDGRGTGWVIHEQMMRLPLPSSTLEVLSHVRVFQATLKPHRMGPVAENLFKRLYKAVGEFGKRVLEEGVGRVSVEEAQRALEGGLSVGGVLELLDG